MSRAIVLFSGGMDSVFCLYQAKQVFDEVECIFFDYGQRHLYAEWKAAWAIANHAGVFIHVEHLGRLIRSKSPLMDQQKPMDAFKDYAEAQAKLHDKIEPAFVPMRNSIFLDLAINYALCEGIKDIYSGISKEDGETVPDCSASWLTSYLITLATGLGMDADLRIRINAPLLMLGKPAAILEALHHYPGCYAAMAFSHTSYFGDFPPSRDHATVCREDAFDKAGVPDPLMVRAYLESKFTPKSGFFGKWDKAIARTHAFGFNPGNMWRCMEEFEKLVRESL
jgi:7-cyano-7-deazaguanine synthase